MSVKRSWRLKIYSAYDFAARVVLLFRLYSHITCYNINNITKVDPRLSCFLKIVYFRSRQSRVS